MQMLLSVEINYSKVVFKHRDGEQDANCRALPDGLALAHFVGGQNHAFARRNHADACDDEVAEYCDEKDYPANIIEPDDAAAKHIAHQKHHKETEDEHLVRNRVHQLSKIRHISATSRDKAIEPVRNSRDEAEKEDQRSRASPRIESQHYDDDETNQS